MKVDPIHFFNARGLSVLTMDDQTEELERLRAEVDHLRGLLAKASAQLRLAGRTMTDQVVPDIRN